jgi:hypothetical protein
MPNEHAEVVFSGVCSTTLGCRKDKSQKKNKLLVQATTYSLVMEYEFISVTNKQSREIVIILFHCIVAPTF